MFRLLRDTRNIYTYASLLTLIVVNVITFHNHYLGEATFPWDFLGGYHFQTYGWYANGSILNPPDWFPWGGIGFPSALAVQSGAWYLPISILDLLGIEYSIHVATSVQCFSVLFGSIGLYLLLRLFDCSSAIAVLGAICFHFSAGFFSNQQHVDIIRGYALLPWLLVSIHPVFSKIKYSIPVASILIFQFLVATYPGIIVSSFYICAMVVIYYLIITPSKLSIKNYLVYISTALALGISLSLLKWLPFFSEYSAIASLGNNIVSPFSSEHLLTLVLPYDVEFLSGDVTMRSLFVPIIAIWGIFFIKKIDDLFLIGFLITSIVIVISVLTTLGLLQYLPGGTISRFPLSDWRGHFHIGILLMAASGWGALLRSELGIKQIVFRTSLFILVSLLVILCAVSVGYPNDMVSEFVLRISMILLLPGLILLCNFRSFTGIKTPALIVIFILIASTDGFFFHKEQNRVWHMSWNEETEKAFFDINFDEIKTIEDEISRRPERLVIGSDIPSVIANSLSPLYNKCWYEKSYCLLGYNNLKYSIPHNTIISFLAENTERSKKLLEFLSRPSQLLIIPHKDSFDLLSIPEGLSFIVPAMIANGKPLVYSSEKIVYELTLNEDSKIIENELWWDGWKYRYCQEHVCSEWKNAQHTDQYLRTIDIPKGHHVIEIIYHQKGKFESQLVALFSILVIFFISIRIRNKLNKS